ncbi:MAG: rhomboid family intramembrane serine protease [Methylocystis sp.]|nr:rhomboid family intramembrane serine protease [Methylocystis sp.]
MAMPLYDDAPLTYVKRPIVNSTLIFINVAVFLLVASEALGDPITIIRGFAIIPRVLFGEAQLAKWVVGPPPALTIITALFFHSTIWHLLTNMLFLHVFGDNVEDAMGSLFYFLFYICCGIASGVFYVYSAPDSLTPLIGASGAISGVCVAFLLLHPNATIAGVFPPMVGVLMPAWLVLWAAGRAPQKLFGLRPPLFIFHASAWLFISVWIFLQFFNATTGGGEGHVAWMAHVGGICAGLVMAPLFKRRAAPMLGRSGRAKP